MILRFGIAFVIFVPYFTLLYCIPLHDFSTLVNISRKKQPGL